ncbi:MAG: hypothetical protein IPP83_10490 [Flavobacteriales bacterium]|nr:hypothetical protein [Flavobacteriales bacterium]
MCTEPEPSTFQTLVDWLNKNSGAIQAASTVVLVAITGWYAMLTKRLASTAREQLDDARTMRTEQLQERSAQLNVVLTRLQDSLLNLPTQSVSPRQIDQVLTNYDELQRSLASLGQGLPEEVSKDLETILKSLRALKQVTTTGLRLSPDAANEPPIALLNLKETTARVLEYLATP